MLGDTINVPETYQQEESVAIVVMMKEAILASWQEGYPTVVGLCLSARALVEWLTKESEQALYQDLDRLERIIATVESDEIRMKAMAAVGVVCIQRELILPNARLESLMYAFLERGDDATAEMFKALLKHQGQLRRTTRARMLERQRHH